MQRLIVADILALEIDVAFAFIATLDSTIEHRVDAAAVDGLRSVAPQYAVLKGDIPTVKRIAGVAAAVANNVAVYKCAVAEIKQCIVAAIVAEETVFDIAVVDTDNISDEVVVTEFATADGVVVGG